LLNFDLLFPHWSCVLSYDAVHF